MERLGLLCIAVVVLLACGGGSGDVAEGPTLTAVSLTTEPGAFFVTHGGGTASISAIVGWQNLGTLSATLTIFVTDITGKHLAIAERTHPNAGGPITFSGSLQGQVSVATAGNTVLILSAYVTDAAGLRSNVLSRWIGVGLQQGPWVEKLPMPLKRSNAAAVASGGLIYLLGGDAGTGASRTVQTFDPVANLWGKVPSMNSARSGAVAGVADGRIYAVAGGPTTIFHGGIELGPGAEEFDPAAGKWRYVKSPGTRTDAAVAVIDNRIVLMGGSIYVRSGSPASGILSSVSTYDPAVDGWTMAPDMPNARTAFAAVALNNRIYAIGGWEGIGGGAMRLVDRFDPAINQWATSAPLPIRLMGHKAVEVSGRIFVIRGFVDDQEPEALWEFLPLTGQLIEKARMPVHVQRPTVAVVGGKVYVFDGSTTLEYAPDRDPQ